MIDHIVFDLDGTLIDSAPLCIEILNEMARDRGSDVQVDPVLARRYLSRGGAAMIAALLGGLAGDANAALAEFRRHYVDRPTPPGSLYDGVGDGLARLHVEGFRLAICSNKPQHLCEKIVADLGLSPLFAAVAGSQPGLRRKPDPQSLIHTLALLGAEPGRSLYVGDSEIDHATAAAAGLAFRFVSYGYADPDWCRPDTHRYDSFAELTGAIIAEARSDHLACG